MPRVSIIVPVYKTEKYIRRCLDSVVGQTLDDIEIILIDDGSPDSCGEICEEYKRKDGRIQVIHQENQGVSAARNAGLQIAEGEYIGFIDSDDFIETDMYEYLLALADRYDADVAGCEFFECYAGREIHVNKEIRCEVLDRIQGIRHVLDSRTSMNVVNKIFRKTLFDGVMFREGKILEDAYIIVDLMANANRSVFTDAQKYYYYHRENSITTRPFDERFYDAIEVHDYNYGIAVSVSGTLAESAQLRRCWARFYVLDKMMSSDGSYDRDKEQECIDFLKKNRHLILNNDVFTRARKLAFIGLLFSRHIYRILLNLNIRKTGRNNG